MFEEMNQSESQKYLDQMKQNLACVSNNNRSTLPLGGCNESFVGSHLQNKRSLTGFYLEAVICLLAASVCNFTLFYGLNDVQIWFRQWSSSVRLLFYYDSK